MILKIILFVSFLCLGLNAEEENCDFDGSLGHLLPNLVIQARRSDECLNKSREIFRTEILLISLEDPLDDDVNDAFYFFGDLVQYLEVDFKNISVDHGKEIVERVNNCSSLTSIILKNVYGNILDNLSGPFSNVKNLELSIHPTEKFVINPNSKKFHEIFPKVNFLYVGNMTSSDEWTFIGETPESLVFLRVIDELVEANEANLVEFIQHNPNVVSLEINFASRRLLNKLNEVLGNSSSLSVNGLSQEYSNDGEVHFENLFSFTFTSKSENDILDGIYLDNIHQLQLDIPYNISNEWMDFLKNQVNTQVKVLRVKTESVSEEQLFAIVEILPNLEEMDVNVNGQTDEILRFLRADNKLKHFRMHSDFSESQARELVLNESNWNGTADLSKW